ncbi:MAG: DUF3617 family protein [Asticcacaulis sp.]
MNLSRWFARFVMSIGLAGLALNLTACDKPEAPKDIQAGSESSLVSGQAEALASEQAANSASNAPEPPKVATRAGLWQLTQTLPQMEATSVRRICVNEAQGKSLAIIGQDLLDKSVMRDLTCSARQVTRHKDSADIDTVCMVNDTTLTSHIHVDIIGNEAFHQTVETRYEPAFAGHGQQVTITDGKRLGDCPSDMKSGDYINADGVRLKAGTVLAKFN